MNNILKNIFIFAIGTAVGSAVTYKIVTTKYEKIVQDEIESVKRHYGKEDVNINNEDVSEESEEETENYSDDEAEEYEEISEEEFEQTRTDYRNLVKDCGYSNDVYDEYEPDDTEDTLAKYRRALREWELKQQQPKKEVVELGIKKPYVIPPEEFDEIDDYSAETLMYYSDGVLTDDWYNPIEDVEGMVGEDSLKTFGRYEEDSVYVRNETLKTDFEILADVRTYSEAMAEILPNKEPK